MTSGRTWSNAASRFAYDVLGQVAVRTSGGTTTTHAFDMGGLMTKVVSGSTTSTCTYDALGHRVKVDGTSSSSWTASIYGGMDLIYEEDSPGSVTKYVTANGMRIAGERRSPFGKDYIGRVAFRHHASVGARQEG